MPPAPDHGHRHDNAADPVAYGGQAVVEGVMMRGRREMAVAVRTPDGEILVWTDRCRSSGLARRIGGWPFVRGGVLLWDTMSLGVRALIFSAATAEAHREVPPGKRNAGRGPAQAPIGGITGPALWGTVALSILFSVLLFFVLPLLVTAWLDRFVGSALVSNLIEGLIRLGILFAYIAGIGYLPEIRRVYGYHGAEHKTVHAWESGDPLDVAHVRRHPLEHPRCGTAFMLVVVLLSMVVFMGLGRPELLPRLASRVVLVPLVAGVAYEVLKFGARHHANRVVGAVLRPSLKLQRLTTRDPDDAMLEVAVAALLRVLVADGRIAADDPRLASARLVDGAGNPLPTPIHPAADPATAEPLAAD